MSQIFLLVDNDRSRVGINIYIIIAILAAAVK